MISELRQEIALLKMAIEYLSRRVERLEQKQLKEPPS